MMLTGVAVALLIPAPVDGKVLKTLPTQLRTRLPSVSAVCDEVHCR
jgi:hypothetical protein